MIIHIIHSPLLRRTIPFHWEQFLFHRGCSFNLKSIEGGAHCNWEKPRRATDCLLHSPGPLRRWFLNKNSFQGGLSKPRHEDRALGTRATDALFFCVLAHVTLAHHTPTLHCWLKDELSIRVCKVILSSHVSSQLAQCL